MITQETAANIFSAYRDIEAGKKLLEDMADHFGKIDKTAPTIKDAFGRKRNLQLGIPSGENAHRIFDLSPRLAESIIRAHIAEKEKQLAELQEVARIELHSEDKASVTEQES